MLRKVQVPTLIVWGEDDDIIPSRHAAADGRRGLTPSAELPDAPVRIRHDPPRMGQVVGNLIGNAIKLTPRGGSVKVEMGATAEDLKLTIHPHPTLSETVMEAAEVFFGQATHVYKPKKKS